MQIGGGRKKLVALEALKEWKEAQSGLEGKVERRTKQTDKLIYEIYQLVGLYSVFVGVVFTAALQSQSVKCQHIWSPVLLCVVAWLIILLVTRKRLKRYKALRVTIKSEDKARAVSSLPSSSPSGKSLPLVIAHIFLCTSFMYM
jgi:protein-S-isoprenylcysteine O-methyltransferase Ste14